MHPFEEHESELSDYLYYRIYVALRLLVFFFLFFFDPPANQRSVGMIYCLITVLGKLLCVNVLFILDIHTDKINI